MRKIRRNSFETNSSSCHAINLSSPGTTMNTDKYPEEIIIRPDEYGWTGPWLMTPEEKTSYLVTGIQYLDKYYDNFAEIENKSCYIEATPEWELLCRIWKEYKGTILQYGECDDYYVDGYIDHQSIYITKDLWESSEDVIYGEIVNFIFNDDITVEITHDNM